LQIILITAAQSRRNRVHGGGFQNDQSRVAFVRGKGRIALNFRRLFIGIAAGLINPDRRSQGQIVLPAEGEDFAEAEILGALVSDLQTTKTS